MAHDLRELTANIMTDMMILTCRDTGEGMVNRSIVKEIMTSVESAAIICILDDEDSMNYIERLIEPKQLDESVVMFG